MSTYLNNTHSRSITSCTRVQLSCKTKLFWQHYPLSQCSCPWIIQVHEVLIMFSFSSLVPELWWGWAASGVCLVRLVPCSCLRGEEETITLLDYSHCSLEHGPERDLQLREDPRGALPLDANQIEELPKVRVYSSTTNTLAMHVSKNLIQCLDSETGHFI